MAVKDKLVSNECLKAVNDNMQGQVSSLKSAVAYKDSTYPDLTSGNAEQLLSTTGVTDKAPYLLRPSAGDGADREMDMLIGGTVAWNQINKNGNMDGTTNIGLNKGTATASDNILTLTATQSATGVGINFVSGLPYKANHKILMQIDIKTALTNLAVKASIGGAETGVPRKSVATNAWTTLGWINTFTIDAANLYMYVLSYSSVASGSTIQYRNAICVDLTQMFGSTIADYVYSLESATAGAGIALLKSWGYFTKPYYPYNAGSLQSVNTSAHEMRDASNNVIATYLLDSDLTLRGIPKLDSNNKLYYDGDTYEADGTVTRRYGIVDLGTLTWEYDSVNAVMGAVFAVCAVGTVNLICGKYYTAYKYWSGIVGATSGIHIDSNKKLYIKDSAYTDAATFKTAMSGVYLVYELATSTTETADPYQTPQILDPNGTEAYIDSRDVPIPVGHETFYPENLRSKVEGLPKNFSTLIAPTEQTYTATQAYASGALFIVQNILYKATASIANGATITPGTNCTATTLAAVIAALA